MRPGYRPDIDGLRAISAVSVVLFHAQVPGFTGGFVGVDVFFVISGYLITQVLLASADQPPRHWLAQFYLRRCRRLLPALLALLLIVTAVAAVWLMPSDRAIYGRFLSATSVLLTNVAAWRGAHGAPALIHLWTIAVEEQFYLIYPLLLLAAGRIRRGRLLALIGVLALASFAISLYATYRAPSANTYLTPPRAWELLLGALTALSTLQIRSRWLCEGLALMGIGILAATIAGYSHLTPYPGLYALPVCLATFALLVTGQAQQTAIGRVLSVRVLVFTGLMSYSLYLWHAAILALFWTLNGGPASAGETLLLLAVIWIIAVCSWRFVEQPVRYRTWPRSDRTFLVGAASLNVALGLVGVLLWGFWEH